MKPRRTVKIRPLHVASILTTVGLAGLACPPHDASANNWPPPAGANMQDTSNWPNDPDYGTTTNGTPDRNGSGGYWNFFSWLPTQAADAPAYIGADQMLGASGMSIDVGWTYTIGTPAVKIAICDSGIEWDNADLANKAYLNAAELAGTHRPQTATGAACGGAGDLAGYDCDGDGVFSVADYAMDARVTAASTMAMDTCFTDPARLNAGATRMVGDINRNCIIDAGDIIELFSDGVDDDANGYTDDISGWDFYKNDNNPYDDTRYGHGTGEARDSSAEGNNAMGGIGACPLCRFMMLRAGDSFIANANDFAKGVVYATDNGASVLQEALGTVDQTAFSRAAIDYAYAHNVTVIASMADENSRHHNMPGTTNHTLPVHAITYSGTSDTSSSSFLAFNTCTNFGGQLAMSISGTSCSSEAAGKGAGIAGLIYSAALSRSQPISLSAEEVMQLFKMTADDINVPQSRDATDGGTSSQYYESLPGFDQRFGYGRANVAKAMAAIEQGLIPPEVDVTSPAWFDTLYAERISGPVPIVGRIAASRATSYDYTVEWAPGVEPLDGTYTTLTTMSNVPASTVTGGAAGMPLASIDPSEVDTAHAPDPDSPHHENDRTITIRVRATAHYGGMTMNGEARRTIAVVNQKNGLDTDLLPGFPLKLGGSMEAGPKLADIDGDGVREIIAVSTDGALHALSLASGTPVELPGFPVMTSQIDGINPTVTVSGVPSYVTAPAYKNGMNGGVDPTIAREAILGPPAIADVDGDGKPNIVFSTWEGSIYVVDTAGQPLAGWPKRLPLVPSCPDDPTKPVPSGECMDLSHGFARGEFGAPVLVDMDKDGKPDIVQAAFDGNIYVWRYDGTSVSGWPVALHDPGTNPSWLKHNRILSTPAAADLDGDGIPELASGSNEEPGGSADSPGGGGSGPAFIIHGTGMNAPGGPYLTHWPIALVSLHLFPVVAEGLDSSPAFADFSGDGSLDILLQGNGAPPGVFPIDPGVQVGLGDPPNRLPQIMQADGTTQIGFDPTSIFGEMSTANRPDTMFPLFSNPSIGDLDQDGAPDVVMSGGSLSLAGNLAGGASTRPFQHLLAMWSSKTGHMMPGSPVVLEDYTFFSSQAIADVGGPNGVPDNYPEVIEGDGAYFVHAVDACGRETPGWPKFTNGWITATPAVGDVNGDHTLEVVTGTRDGYLYAWTTKGTDTGVIQWESFHHDNANTGNYTTPLHQGVLEKASALIDCTPPTVAPNPSYDAGGCAASPDLATTRAPWLLAFTALAAAFRRRRSRR
jgi:hypothetical protein